MRVLPIPEEITSLLFNHRKTQQQLYDKIMKGEPPSGFVLMMIDNR